MTVRARNTKDKKDARLYIQRELADLLKSHNATKAPGAKVFAMPHVSNLARMLRADLLDARQSWLKAASSDAERLRREQSDFLCEENHEGEQLDFHALRHTLGAWLAKCEVHPKTVQTVMRHSAITLTMDTYGHLFPGQEADAVRKLPGIFGDETALLQATGTDDHQLATSHMPANRQQWSGETGLDVARRGDGDRHSTGDAVCPKVIALNTLGDKRQYVARRDESRPGRIRTSDQGIMSPVKSVFSGLFADNDLRR